MKNVHPSREELTTDFTARQSRNRMSRSAWSAWSLLPLWRAVGGPKAPASWPHSRRFARFASRAAQPVRTRIKRTVAFRPPVSVWLPLATLGIPPEADISQRDKAATKILSKKLEDDRVLRAVSQFPSPIFYLPSSIFHHIRLIREIRGQLRLRLRSAYKKRDRTCVRSPL